MSRELDRQRLAAARLWAAHRFPYLASGLFAARVVPVAQLGGMAVDESWRLYVDPDLAAEWSVEEYGSLLVHHTAHLLRDHAARAADMGIGRDEADDWTKAADAEINDDLVEAGLEMPGQPVLPQSFGCDPGRFAEEYFHTLRKDEQESASASCDCGSGVDSHERGWDEPPDAGTAISKGEAKLIRCQVAGEILRHAQGKLPGSVPMGLRRWAEALLEPKVDWRTVLAAEVRRGIADIAGKVDYTYSRPSRRQSVLKDVILPALRRPVPHVAVVCDTSGSMSEDLLTRALSEVEGLLRGLGMRRERVRVLSCDASVHVVQRVSSAKQVELYGGGGTNMGEGIDAAMRLRPRPTVVVVLTDGYTPWPPEGPKGTHVVIGVLDNDSWATPPWARVVHIEDVA